MSRSIEEGNILTESLLTRDQETHQKQSTLDRDNDEDYFPETPTTTSAVAEEGGASTITAVEAPPEFLEGATLSAAIFANLVSKFFLPEASSSSAEIPSNDDTPDGSGDENVNADRTGPGDEEPDESQSCTYQLLTFIVAQLNRCFEISNPNFVKSAILLGFSVITLQVAFLLWGYLLEMIMTTNFSPTDRVPDDRFPSATFSVWTNRFGALLVSTLTVSCRHGLKGAFRKSPLVSFSPCAVAYTLSSISLYAALRYVSFPVMTIFKSSKIVSVIFVGKLMNKRRYAWGEYVEAVLITIGVAIFSITQRNFNSDHNAMPIYGYLLLLAFLLCDSFSI